jgi:phosphoribosyl 1,2-cyclic phosphodiesterase
MVRFTVLASGSKGNSSIVSCTSGTGGSTRVLVDAGLSCRELFRRMKQIGEDPGTLDAILVTHEHQDHINGLAVTARKLGIPVYFTEATHRAWVRQVTPQKRITYAEWAQQYREQKQAAEAANTYSEAGEGPKGGANAKSEEEYGLQSVHNTPATNGALALEASLSPPRQIDLEACADLNPPPEAVVQAPKPDPAHLPSVSYFRPGETFAIGDISISPFTIPHDAADPVGFVFSAEGVRLAIATDLGYMPPNVQAQLRRCDLIMLESNHDLEMLRDGPYPWSVKQRVLSRVGHLSNDAASAFLEETYDGAATYLILAHLSESNNLPELARLAAERALISKPNLLANRLYLASQDEPLDPVCF